MMYILLTIIYVIIIVALLHVSTPTAITTIIVL